MGNRSNRRAKRQDRCCCGCCVLCFVGEWGGVKDDRGQSIPSLFSAWEHQTHGDLEYVAHRSMDDSVGPC
jgi:hypothetical protein